MEATNVNSIETGKWILETFAAWLLPRLTQMMLVSGRGLDSWTKLNKQTNKMNHYVWIPPVIHLTAMKLKVKGEVVFCTETPGLSGAAQRSQRSRVHTRIWRRLSSERTKARKGTTITQAVCGSQLLTLRSCFLQAPDCPPSPPPPTNGFNRRSAWLGCGHTSNPEEW